MAWNVLPQKLEKKKFEIAQQKQYFHYLKISEQLAILSPNLQPCHSPHSLLPPPSNPFPIVHIQIIIIKDNLSMPKHQGPIQRLIDPFSIPAQMNNLGVLIVAYVTRDMYDQSLCTDPQDVKFLNFIYYGSTIVCGGTFLMSMIYMIGLLDYCINKVMPCGEVCLTLNTLTIFLAGIIYHCVATVYGMLEMFWGAHSKCIEIEMFKRITCTIYLIWFLCILAYLLFNIFQYNRKKQLQTVDEQYIEM